MTTTYTIETIRNYRTTKTRRFNDYAEAIDTFATMERIDDGFLLLSRVEVRGTIKSTTKIAHK